MGRAGSGLKNQKVNGPGRAVNIGPVCISNTNMAANNHS